jgi:hypothetical protein
MSPCWYGLLQASVRQRQWAFERKTRAGV